MTYNGHKNWNHWNVSLWINNDEGLSRTARHFARRMNRRSAAVAMMDHLTTMGVTHTPDGAPYTAATIRAAMIETV
jgi:hypothetical protein